MKLRKSKNIAVAFSGGAALGIAHIGVLKAFEEYKIKPNFVSGTSAGAVAAAFYARGFSASEIEDLALSIDKKQTLKLFAPTLNKGGLIDGKNICDFIRHYLGDVNIEDLPIKYIAVSVNLQNGDILYINQGNLISAIRASISIPGVFLPYEANNTFLIDGGLRTNLPLHVLRSFDPDYLIGINVLKTKQLKLGGTFVKINNDNTDEKSRDENFFYKIAEAIKTGNFNRQMQIPRLTKIGYLSLKILLSELSNKEIELTNPDMNIEVDVSHIKLWEFWKAKEMIRIGYEAAKESIVRSLK